MNIKNYLQQKPSLFSIFQYYNETEAAKYASNSHITAIQHEMAERALELLALPEGKSGFLLDIGKESFLKEYCSFQLRVFFRSFHSFLLSLLQEKYKNRSNFEETKNFF